MDTRNQPKEYAEFQTRLNNCLFQINNPSSSQHHHRSYPKPAISRSHVSLEGFDTPSTLSNPTGGLSNILACGTTSVVQIQAVIRRLSEFSAFQTDHAMGKAGDKEYEETSKLLEEVAHAIFELARETFGPIHRICQTAIGLYMIEDLIRDPPPRSKPFRGIFGRIKIPPREIIEIAVQKLKSIFENFSKTYANFKCRIQAGRRSGGSIGEEMRKILRLIHHGINNVYHTAIGAFNLFDLLLFIDIDDQYYINDFFASLNSMEKSDLLENISNLRRIIDHIPLLLEKLSWGCYTIYRLTNGTSPPSTPLESGSATPILVRSTTSSKVESNTRVVKPKTNPSPQVGVSSKLKKEGNGSRTADNPKYKKRSRDHDKGVHFNDANNNNSDELEEDEE